MQERVYIVQTPVRDIPAAVSLWPETWSGASLTHGKAYHKTPSTKQLVMEIGESDYVQTWGKRTSLWASAKLKPALFRANTLHNRFFSEPPTVYRGKHVVSRHLRRSYLKANKVSKREGTKKVKHAYHLWQCADAADRKLSKLIHASRSYSLPKLARFLRHSVSLCYVEMFCVLIQCYDNIRNDKALADDAVFKILLSRTSTSMFATAATRVWNSLPPDMRKLELSYGQFRRSLNTFLFGQWDHGALWTA